MINVELDEAAENRLRARAEAKGLQAEAYAKELLEGLLMPNGERSSDDIESDPTGEPFPVLAGYVPALSNTSSINGDLAILLRRRHVYRSAVA